LFEGGEPLRHVWLFFVAPLLGGALAAVVHPVLTSRPTTGGHRARAARRAPEDAAVPEQARPAGQPQEKERPAAAPEV
jgi:aquaporin Z